MTADNATPDSMPKRRYGRCDDRPSLTLVMRNLRKTRGMTQAELAETAGVPRTTISALETNDRALNVETLLRVLRALKAEFVIEDRTEPLDGFDEDEYLRSLGLM